MRVVVAGGGVAGLSASLALARAGADVTLIERDLPEEVPQADSYESRPGCPQTNQGHSFLARARKILATSAPDVLQALIDAGGNECDGNIVLPPQHQDPELISVAIRRPLIDEVLLRFVRAEPNVAIEYGVVAELRGTQARVSGVKTKDGRAFDADLVLDAAGRRSAFPGMLRAIGAPAPAERRNDVGVVYYGRYYETAPGAQLPPKFAPVSVRASLGYLGFALFWQDARIVAIGLTPEDDDRDFRALREEPAFTAAVRAIKPIAQFADESFARPVSGMVVMGALQNMRRSYVRDGAPLARGFAGIGDSICHTDPTPAYGMSMALEQAFALPSLLDSPQDAAVVLEERVVAELDERYEQVSAANRERAGLAKGRAPDLETDDELVLEQGWPLLFGEDPGVLRRYMRRQLALDPPGDMTNDADLMNAARAALKASGALEKKRRPARDEMLAIMGAAQETAAV